MPTYVYKCSSCNQTIEIKQSISDEPIKICTNCNQDQLKRIITNVSIQFVGSGFYVNDKGGKNGRTKSN